MASSLFRLGGLAILLMAVSCSGPLFSKIEVRASPTVYAALGNAKGIVSDYVSVSKIRDQLKSSEGVKVYDYQDPADNDQKFLISYPLTSVDLDIASYLKNLKLDSSLSQSLTPGSFTVPDINQTKSQSASFSLNSTLQSQVNSGFAPKTSTVAETGSPTPISATVPDVSISVTTFKTATFSAGSLNLALSMTNASADLVFNATVELVDDSGATIATSNSVNVKSGTAVLSLAGKTLTSDFKVRFTATTSGGQSPIPTPKQVTINVSPSLSGAVVSAATGVNINTSVTTPATTIPVNTGGKLVSAKVATGKITINQSAFPNGWTGFTRTTSITLTQGSTTLATVANATTDSFDLVLDTKTIDSQDITVTATTSVSGTNASFSGLTSAPVTFNVDSVVKIDKFSTIKVKPGADFKPTQVITQTVTDDLKKWVKKLYFKEVGVKFTLNNNLGAGNDMALSVTSNAFQLTAGTPITVPGDGTSKVAKFTTGNASTASIPLASEFELVPASLTDLSSPADGKPDFDFTVKLLPTNNYDSVAGTFDLVDIVPGTALSISGSVEFVSDWSKADIDPSSNGGQSGTFPSDGSKLDLGDLKTYLGTGINFASIQGYLYISGFASGTKVQAQVYASYTDGTPKTKVLAGTSTAAGGTEDLDMASVPTLPTGDTITTTWPTTASKSFTIEDVLNAKPKDLKFNYFLNMNALTITNDVNQPNPKIQANLVIILPMSLVVAAGGAALDAGNNMPKDDLFGRKVGSDNSNIEKALDQLVSMKLSLAVDNKTGFSGTAKLTEGNGLVFDKSIVLPSTTGTVEVTLNKAEIQYIKNTVPFVTKLKVDLPPGPMSLKRGGSINATITASVATDINQTFDLKGTK